MIKKILLYKINYLPEPYTRIKNKIKVELDLSNYATKSDLKITTGAAQFAKKTCLVSLKSRCKLEQDIDKLKKCTKWFK